MTFGSGEFPEDWRSAVIVPLYSRGLLGIRRRDKGPIAWVREFCGVTRGENERIEEGSSNGSAMWRE